MSISPDQLAKGDNITADMGGLIPRKSAQVTPPFHPPTEATASGMVV